MDVALNVYDSGLVRSALEDLAGFRLGEIKQSIHSLEGMYVVEKWIVVVDLDLGSGEDRHSDSTPPVLVGSGPKSLSPIRSRERKRWMYRRKFCARCQVAVAIFSGRPYLWASHPIARNSPSSAATIAIERTTLEPPKP